MVKASFGSVMSGLMVAYILNNDGSVGGLVRTWAGLSVQGVCV